MITEFIGKFHPVVVHLPIGILFLAFIQELLLYKNKIKEERVIFFTTLLGSFFAIVAALLGWALSLDGGYNETLLNKHQYFGWTLCLFSLLLVFFKKYFSATLRYKVVNRILWAITITLLFIVGHFGGSLTHGSDFISFDFKNVPVKKALSIDSIAALPPIKQSSITVYEGLVYPILDKKCNQCHNDQKKKGNLKMVTLESLLKGGKHGPALQVFNAKESELIKRVLLDPADEKHMPPAGKTPLTLNELSLLYWWIQHGASVQEKIGNVIQNDSIIMVLKSKMIPPTPTLSLPAIGPIHPSKQIALQNSHLAVLPISKGVNYVEVSAINNPLIGDQDINPIVAIDSHLVWLNISNTKITNKALSLLVSCKNITKLNLTNTNINDDCINIINQFSKLNYLNIVGTGITDNGLMQLKLESTLKVLYCWNTKISSVGIQRFKKLYPNIQINNGPNEK